MFSMWEKVSGETMTEKGRVMTAMRGERRKDEKGRPQNADGPEGKTRRRGDQNQAFLPVT